MWGRFAGATKRSCIATSTGIRCLQEGYDENVPYHNATHAADVTCRFFAILRVLGAVRPDPHNSSMQRFATAMLVSAAAHDYMHPGYALAAAACLVLSGERGFVACVVEMLADASPCSHPQEKQSIPGTSAMKNHWTSHAWGRMSLCSSLACVLLTCSMLGRSR